MTAALLDQAAGDEIGLVGILRRARPRTGLLDLALDLRREALPHQFFGKVHRGRDQHERGQAGICLRAPRQLPRKQQSEPAAHGGADHHLRSAAAGIEYGQAFLKPSADGSVGEIAPGLAMAGIVEARHGAAMVPRPLVEGLRLGAFHVGLESPEPEQARARSLARPHGDAREPQYRFQHSRISGKDRSFAGSGLGVGVHLHCRPAVPCFRRMPPLNASAPCGI